MNRQNKFSYFTSFSILLLLSFVFLFPLYLVVINSFKSKFNIISEPFVLPNQDTFVGFENYINGINSSGILGAFIRTLIITVGSVVTIVVLTSMTAWYITRVKSKVNRVIYYLFLFSMIVPFQMVMFTMTDICYKLGLNSVLGIIPVYLGFGSGLSVFMFCGFVKGLPREIEEAAMIDGCSPLKTFFYVVFPILKPTAITESISCHQVNFLDSVFSVSCLSLFLAHTIQPNMFSGRYTRSSSASVPYILS